MSTIEQIRGLVRSDFIEMTDGRRVVEGEGHTVVDWDSSKTVGVECRSCGWDCLEADWLEQLLPYRVGRHD